MKFVGYVCFIVPLTGTNHWVIWPCSKRPYTTPIRQEQLRQNQLIQILMQPLTSVVSLTLVVLPTMTTLSLLLAVAPMKWIIKMAAVSVIIDLLVLAYYFFAG